MGKRAAAPADRADPEELGEEAVELVEVPAAVVCATCGDPICPGCADVDEITQASGVVAVIPWERPGGSVPMRLLETARLSTVNGESFFGALPAGDVAVPLRFAVIAEHLAIGSLALFWGPILYAFAPSFWQAAWADPAARRVLLMVLLVGIPVAAWVMVLIHAVWGLSLELGVRRAGGKPSWKKGLRFAMYSCGWDLVTSPFGLAALALVDGPSKSLAAGGAALRVPTKATRAFVGGVHRLPPPDARRASRVAWGVTASFLLVGAVVAVGLAALWAVVAFLG